MSLYEGFGGYEAHGGYCDREHIQVSVIEVVSGVNDGVDYLLTYWGV